MDAFFADTTLDVEELHRGFALPWLVVMDNFLRDPEVLRRRALQLSYVCPGYYPGLTSREVIRTGKRSGPVDVVHVCVAGAGTLHEDGVRGWGRSSNRTGM